MYDRVMASRDEDIGMFKALVYERSHLFFPESRELQLRRWIMQRVEEGNHGSLRDYYRVLAGDSEEFGRLISLITTRETYFFRMPEHFEVIGEYVLPQIIDSEGRKAMAALSRGEQYRMRLRAWSAGCATGQETYSLCMKILDTVHYSKAWDIKVLGTDINPDGLEFAKRGRYDRMKIGKTPSEYLERFFNLCSAEEIGVSDELKEIVEFQTMNLRNLFDAVLFRNSFDIILCRNVMIYFDLPAQQRLVSSLIGCLRPGGFLFTGEGEVLHLYNHDLEVVERGGCIFYRKSEGMKA